MIDLTGLQHVAINASNLAESRAFYVDTLGLRELDRPDFGIPGLWLGLPDGRAVHLVETPHEAHAGYHFALEVPDVQAAVDQLRAEGVTISDPFELIPGSGLQAFVNDPAGNVVELNQPTL
jgi:catechol 2,3-dioxygenase-like lactoylglutathione lyase family enzyme